MAIDLKKLNIKNLNFDVIANLSLKIKIIILCVLVLLIWGLYTGLLLYPKYQAITKLKSENADLTQKRDAKAKDAAYLPQLKKEVTALEQNLKYSLLVLPNSEEIPQIIKTVENKLKDNNLDILSFKPENEVKQDFYAQKAISLRFTGSFKSVGDFCQALARQMRVINITNISIRDPKPAGGKTTLSVETQAIIYRFLRPEETAPKQEPKKEAPKSEKKS